MAELTESERAVLAREVAADNYYNRADYLSYDDFRAGWDAAMDYIKEPKRLPPEYQTMRELLDYPNTIGIYGNEARYRDFARALIGINVQTKEQQS